jgi:hypothetical protein
LKNPHISDQQKKRLTESLKEANELKEKMENALEGDDSDKEK